YEVERVAADQLLRNIAQKRNRGRLKQDGPVWPDHRDQVAGVLDEGAEALLAVLEEAFGAFRVRQVANEGREAGQGARGRFLADHAELAGELAAVRAHGRQLDAAPDDSRLAGFEIAAEARLVTRAVAR